MSLHTVTRSMSKTLNLEKKLQNALEQIKLKQTTIDQLLTEREEHEKEMENILSTNKKLKTELSELDIAYMDVLDQRDHLQKEVDTLLRYSSEYEQALHQINNLERELNKARTNLAQYENKLKRQQMQNTLALYDELLGEPCEKSKYKLNYMNRKVSRKIWRLRKCIKKSSDNRNKYFKNNIKLQKERSMLLQKLNLANAQIKINCDSYNEDIQSLKTQLEIKVSILESLSIKYELAKKEIEEHILAAEKLVELSSYNADRFDSLVKNHACTCMHDKVFNQHKSSLGHTKYLIPEIKNIVPVNENVSVSNQEIIIFSDEMGKNMASLIKNQTNLSVYNCCLPQSGFKEIMNKIRSYEFDTNTSIIIAIGNSFGTTNKDVISGLDYLCNLNVKKIIFCLFPYLKSITQKLNNRIYYLNSLIYKMTSSYSDEFILFDTNKFISDMSLTRDALYLSKKSKNLLSTLLVYNILHSTRNCTRTVIQLCFKGDTVDYAYKFNKEISTTDSIITLDSDSDSSKSYDLKN